MGWPCVGRVCVRRALTVACLVGWGSAPLSSAHVRRHLSGIVARVPRPAASCSIIGKLCPVLACGGPGLKALLAVIFLVTCTLAQDQAAITRAQSACGPQPAQFAVRTEKGAHPAPQTPAGKALVYIVEDQRQDLRPCLGNCGALTRLAMDGAWMGANRGSSYFSFFAAPGEHHLCAGWEKGGKRPQDRTSLAGFTAEPGRVYYFRVRVTNIAPPAGFYSIDLEPLNADQGQLLVAASPRSTFRQTK